MPKGVHCIKSVVCRHYFEENGLIHFCEFNRVLVHKLCSSLFVLRYIFAHIIVLCAILKN